MNSSNLWRVILTQLQEQYFSRDGPLCENTLSISTGQLLERSNEMILTKYQMTSFSRTRCCQCSTYNCRLQDSPWGIEPQNPVLGVKNGITRTPRSSPPEPVPHPRAWTHFQCWRSHGSLVASSPWYCRQ